MIGTNFRKIIKTIDLNVLYAKKEKTYPAYVSKYNSNRKKQVIFLMIPNKGKLYYLTIKKLSALLRGITSKNDGVFYCLNCLHSFRIRNKLQSDKKVCKNNKDICNIVIPSERTKRLEFNPYQKSDKAKFIIYADLGCLIVKIDGSKNDLENSFTSKVSEHIASCF